ncbi:glycosyltransferase [Vibrio echinoideorum]|uniref:Glycosyltransferase n=1 Tax=Vibrio echinoideorum TaxID=2100116 RepID=A0ABU9FT57_9VIBR
MKKLLMLSSSYPIHPRLEKVSRNIDAESFGVCAWNRGGFLPGTDEHDFVYNCPIGYKSKLYKILYFLLFAVHFRRTIKIFSPDIVVCRYWDMFVLASLVCPSKIKIVYDVCDMPSSFIVRLLERLFLKRANEVYISSRFFQPFYSNLKNITLFENKPDVSMFAQLPGRKGKIDGDNKNNPINLVFLGKVRYYKIMVNAIEACRDFDSELFFSIYGDGPDLDALKAYVCQNEIRNVEFHGRYDYKNIAHIYSVADLIWAAYDSNVDNVKYAISNKFFESIFFKIPGIYSKNTKLGSFVEKEGIGFTVEEGSIESIKEQFRFLISNRQRLNDVSECLHKNESKLLT